MSVGRGSMGIVHVSSAHPASDPRIHLREAATLAAAGYDVTLVAVSPQAEMPDTGVKVVTLPRRRRLMRMTVSAVQAVALALRTKARIVHLHDPELVWAIPLLRARGRVVVYDAHEDLPHQVLNKPYLPGPLGGVASRLAHLVVRAAARADHVVAATEPVAQRFPARKVTTVRNYPILRSSESPTPAEERPPNVAYLGAISTTRGAAEMVDALASDFFPQDWRAIMAGAVPPALLDSLREREGWARADYRGFLAPDAARDLLEQCRVGLVTLQRTPAYLDSLPTKMFEYFAAGIPVVASDFPLWRSIVEQYECGLLVDERDPDSIAAAVAAYANDPAMLARHGENARDAARHHLNWASQATILVDLYHQLDTSRETA